MGRQMITYLEVSEDKQNSDESSQSLQRPKKCIYACKYCNIHLAQSSNLLSKSFHGKTGAAFLFGKVVNIFLGPESEKDMMTGKHIVCDIYCNICKKVIGWTYVSS